MLQFSVAIRKSTNNSQIVYLLGFFSPSRVGCILERDNPSCPFKK